MDAEQIEAYALKYLDSLDVAAESIIDYEMDVVEITFDVGIKRALLRFTESKASIEDIINQCIVIGKNKNMNINDKFRLAFHSSGVFISAPVNKSEKLNLDNSIMYLRNEYSRLNYKNNYAEFYRASRFLSNGGSSIYGYGFMPHE